VKVLLHPSDALSAMPPFALMTGVSTLGIPSDLTVYMPKKRDMPGGSTRGTVRSRAASPGHPQPGYAHLFSGSKTKATSKDGLT
jgi:hypothetical protein